MRRKVGPTQLHRMETFKDKFKEFRQRKLLRLHISKSSNCPIIEAVIFHPNTIIYRINNFSKQVQMAGQITIDTLRAIVTLTTEVCSKEYLTNLMQVVEHQHKIDQLNIYYSITHPVEAYMAELVEMEIEEAIIPWCSTSSKHPNKSVLSITITIARPMNTFQAEVLETITIIISTWHTQT